MAMALIPLCCRFCTWSFMRAMRGVTTSARPSFIMAGTWKHMDFPPPVGSMASVSRPSRAEVTISFCMGRKLS